MNKEVNVVDERKTKKKINFKLKKKAFDYFGCFIKMAQIALDEANLLKDVLAQYNPDLLEQNKEQIHALEHACDMEKHALTSSLIKDFLPPIDREDLFSLAHIADNFTDSIESTLVFFYMANITRLREDACAFADLIVSAAQMVKEIFGELNNFKKPEKLKELIMKLNDLEEEGDKMYMQAVHKLSKESVDTREIIEWRDVYRCFEKCFDSAEAIADNIESIVMKNS